MRVIGFMALFAMTTAGTVRADGLLLQHPTDSQAGANNSDSTTLETSASSAKHDEASSSDLYHHSYSSGQCNACSSGRGHRWHGGRADHCGSIDGYPGGCGEGPGCCGNLWDTYCQDRKPCWSPGSPRRHMKFCLPKLSCGIPCVAGCCERPLAKPCFTNPCRGIKMPSLVLPCIKKPNFSALVGRFGHATACDQGCDLNVCDTCDDAAAKRPSEMADPPVPSGMRDDDRDSDALPPPSPAPSAQRGFFPFTLNAPQRSLGSQVNSAKRRFSLPLPR